MFFKKYREAKKEAAADAQHQALEAFQARIDAAVSIADLESKLKEFDKIARDLMSAGYDEEKAIRGRANKVSAVAALGVGVSATLVGFAIVGICGFPPSALILAALPGALSGMAASEVAQSRISGSGTDAAMPYFEALEEKRISVGKIVSDVVSDNLDALVTSPSFDKLRHDFGLQAHFIEALERRVTAETAKPTDAPKRPPGLSL